MTAWFECVSCWCRKNNRSILDIIGFLLVAAAVVIVWWGAWLWIDTNISPSVAQESVSQARGLFGDKFGAVNSLFSGLAFAGIILTLMLQRRELANSRKEVSHQQFDHMFFSLLRLHVDITSKISHYGDDGRKAFLALYNRIRNSNEYFPAFLALQKINKERIREIKDHPEIDKDSCPELSSSDVSNLATALADGVRVIDAFLDEEVKMHERIVADAYGKVADASIDDFAHYYRNLYHILRFIDRSDLISNSEKFEYAKFVRAQLSDVELVTIFYNSLTQIQRLGKESIELGYPKMTRLLKKYDILQNMNSRSVIHPIHFEIFDKNAR